MHSTLTLSSPQKGCTFSDRSADAVLEEETEFVTAFSKEALYAQKMIKIPLISADDYIEMTAQKKSIHQV